MERQPPSGARGGASILSCRGAGEGCFILISFNNEICIFEFKRIVVLKYRILIHYQKWGVLVQNTAQPNLTYVIITLFSRAIYIV